jgi:hypothetical protein
MNVRSAVEMLWPDHAEHLAGFRVPPEMLEAAGIRSVSDAEARVMLGLHGHRGADLGGILFPYFSPLTGARAGGRIRLDHLLPDDGKYISEPGCRHLFFAPCPKELLADTSVPVIVVEAEKSSLALTALAKRTGRKFLVIAIGGCWGWKRKTSKLALPDGGTDLETGPAPDLDVVVWQGRSAILAFDSNAQTNPKVQQALRALAKELAARGAIVSIAVVPAIEGVNGPDDLIAVSGDEVMLGVLDSAQPLSAVVTLRPGELPTAVDQAEDILMGHCEELKVFQRAGEMVRIISLPEPFKGGGLRRPSGTVQLEPLSGVALTEIFDRIARWQKLDREGNERVVDCPPRIASAYLSRAGAWRVPILTGITSTPILREEGTILAKLGYDGQTGIFFASDESWPAIPESPTRADAEAALERLLAPFSEFPFVAEEDRAVHMACILTAIQRRLLKACPIFGYGAPAQRSGKSLLAEAVAVVGTGKPAPATAVSGDREEMRKAITSALREGHSIINLDNIEHPLSSPDLAKAITQSEYQDRLLGESRMLRLPTNVLWTATGNNLTFRGDLSSRALLCRIDSGMERPEERAFKIPDLINFLIENRRRLVTAALTILRAFHVAGHPSQSISAWGGFNNWSASIREPLIWAGLADPCKSRETVLADDPEREESVGVLRSLDQAFVGGQFTVKEIVDRCATDDSLKSSILVLAAGRQHRDEVDSRRLGWWLRRVRDRIIDGLRLHFCGRASGAARWRVIKVTAGGVGGLRGFRDQFPVTEGTTEPPSGCLDSGEDAGRLENDHQNHQNPEDDEVVI